MDSPLNCNTLTCREPLTESAVATSCCHLFCMKCSESSGPSVQPDGNRTCPACHAYLPNPDDAVFVDLNPSEEYKSVVLIGLHPTAIMECAARALAFWFYQCSQEIALKKYQQNSIEVKNNRLKADMGKLIASANVELNLFNDKLSDANLEIERLKAEQEKLKSALFNKTRVHHRTLELYDRLKRKEMTAATKSAALDSLDDVLVLHSMANRQDSSQPTLPPPYQQNTRPHTTQPGFSPGRMDYGGQRQLHNHNNRLRKVGSNSSNSAGRMMPPPPTRGAATAAFGIRDFESGQPGPSIQSHTQLISPSNPNPDFFNHTGHNSLSTPSHYRPQLGNMPPAGNAERNTGIYLSSAGRLSTGRLPQQTPPSSQRQPLAREGDSSINRSHMSGYGINAGMRVGGQPQVPYGTDPTANQGQERPRIIHPLHPLAQTPQHPHQPGDGFY